MADDDRGPPMRIEDAPYRVRREHMRRERWMNLLAITVIATVVLGVAYLVTILVR